MNGVNLNLFQFESDLTWMSFFMDAHDRFYARYGGRGDSSAESHLTKKSLVRIMQQALALHKTKSVQTSRYEPTAKTVSTPEDIPTMKAMLRRRKNKCIHCHDVKVARLRHLQALNRFAREMVFTYPTSANVGIQVDADKQNVVRSVTPNSPAARAGVRSADVLLASSGQRILTLADFSRVLELTPKQSTLPLDIQRDGRTVRTTLKLSGNWRKSTDPSWRESLHVAGPNAGFWARKLNAGQRRKLKIPGDELALRVVAIWGGHTRRAGVKNGDVVVAIDGIRRDLNIKQLHAYLMLQKNYGDNIPLIVRRRGKDVKLNLALPSGPPKLE